jgi:hypothetical protein
MNETTAALFSTLGFLLLGVLMALGSKHYLKLDSGAFLGGMMFAPILMFLAMSGRLVEFKGLGLEAKFQQAARQQVKPLASTKPVSRAAPSAKGIRDTSDLRSFFGIGSEVVIITAGREDKPVTRQAVIDVALQIYHGLLQGKFEILAVLDESDRLLGYFPRSSFLDLLRIEIEQTIRGDRKQFDSKRVGEQIEQTQLWDIVEYPRTRAERSGIKGTVRISDSNARALASLHAAKLPAMVVVDNEGKYAGIVRREDILSELVISLSDISSPSEEKK